MSPDGYITITGRVKDLIIRGGENIHPLEIENCLLTYPGVIDASAVGVPDERYGEAVAVFIIHREPESEAADEDKIRQWVREKLSNHLGMFPLIHRNALSILKRSLIDWYSAKIRFLPATIRVIPQDCKRQGAEVQASGRCC